MPELLRLYRELEPRGMRLLLVSADFPEATNDARRFLRRVGVDFPTYLKTGEDMAFIEALEPSWSGALPATFVYDGAGRLRHVWTGKTTYEELKRVVLEVFESSAGPTKEGS
jgi:peroxiredoxin